MAASKLDTERCQAMTAPRNKEGARCRHNGFFEIVSGGKFYFVCGHHYNRNIDGKFVPALIDEEI